MFTRMSKILLNVVEVALVIVAIIVGNVVGKATGGGTGFLAFLIFLVTGFLAVFALGLFVELANNILDIKQILEKQTYTAGNYTAESTSEMSQILASPLLGNTKNSNPDFWICRRCHMKNSNTNLFCKDCGEKK